ncbi:lectin [Streptomyces aureoverticillatus]|nr:lectin [Streptomyces aureoverticillatus]
MTLVGQASAAPSDHTPASAASSAAKPGPLADQVRYAPFTLNHNESVSSNTARLVMQSDGNLVIYDEFNRARWATRTVGQGWTTSFQEDGNLVVYTRNGRAVWASNTAGHPGSRLVVQDDGNVVIYDGSQAIWSSRTNH